MYTIHTGKGATHLLRYATLGLSILRMNYPINSNHDCDTGLLGNMNEEPHSVVFGWPLDDIGPILCDHIGLDYDQDWRLPDSTSTWHLEIYEWLKEKGLDLFISFGQDDWGESRDGRYILGENFALVYEELVAGCKTGLKDFLDHATQKEIELPPIQNFFYFGDESYGWAVDTYEWMEWKARLGSNNNGPSN